MTDHQLMKAVGDGDARAVELLVKRYQKRVLRYLLGRLSDPEDALDVTQEVFVRLCQKGHLYSGAAPLSAWIFRVAKNLQADHCRGKNFRIYAGSVPADESWQQGVKNLTPSPERVALNREVASRVESAIEALPTRQREVVQLRLLGELTLEEISAVVGLSLGGVKSTLHNALRSLREKLIDLKDQAYVQM